MNDFLPVNTNHPQFKDLTGRTFGKLIVLKLLGRCGAHTYWLCRCKCGTEKAVRYQHLAKGLTISCGCHRKKVAATHGMAHSRIYKIWQKMKDRCHNPDSDNYSSYGGRGISVFGPWRESFESFLAHVGSPPSPRHTLDRIDNDGSYEPGNVRWATKTEQQNNKRNNQVIELDGKRMTVAQWSRETGIRYDVLRGRIRYGWTIRAALTTPVGRKRPQS